MALLLAKGQHIWCSNAATHQFTCAGTSEVQNQIFQIENDKLWCNQCLHNMSLIIKKQMEIKLTEFSSYFLPLPIYLTLWNGQHSNFSKKFLMQRGGIYYVFEDGCVADWDVDCTQVHISAHWCTQMSIVEHLVHIRCIWCISTHIGAYWYP